MGETFITDYKIPRILTPQAAGSRDLKLGTVRAAVRQLGIDWQRFQDA
jgi:hypothetical protein